MMRLFLIAAALVTAVTPAQGQDMSTMSASAFMSADVAKQYAVIGYVIGRYELATDTEGKALAECIQDWLARPSDDGLWSLTEFMHAAATLAAFGTESTMPMGEVFDRALRAECE